MWLTGLVAPWHVGSSQTRARTRVPCIGRQILNHCATREALENSFYSQIISAPPRHVYQSKAEREFFFFNKLFIYLFIYFWLRWVFVAVRALSLVAEGATLCCSAGLLIAVASLVAEHGSRHVCFSSCGTWAQ